MSSHDDRDTRVALDDDDSVQTDTEVLEVGVLLQAMQKCIDFYDQRNKVEFYGMVTEEYGTLLPDYEDVSVDAIEQTEEMLQRVARSLFYDDNVTAEVVPAEVQPHVQDLLAFYRALGVLDTTNRVPSTPDERKPEPAPLANIHTEESSNSPRNRPTMAHASSDDLDSEMPENAVQVQQSASGARSSQQISSTINGDAPTTSHRPGTLSDSGFMHMEAYQKLSELMEERVEANRMYATELARANAERESMEQIKMEYKALKAVVKEERARAAERKRVHQLMESTRDEEYDGSSSLNEDRSALQREHKALRKEQKRFQRLQDEHALRFKLIESENDRHKMEVEKKMEDLRREYSESYLFPGISLP